MKWYCPPCSPTATRERWQPCPSCCGFRPPATVPGRLFQPGRVTESTTGSWVRDRHTEGGHG